MEYITLKKRLVKDVADRGHSGGVYLPKSWVGQKVLIQPISVKEYILDVLSPYTEDIVGVYLYGSYARAEQTEESDIDILVISEKKLPKKEGLANIERAAAEDIKRLIRSDPVTYYSIVQEALPIINAPLLKELKAVKPDRSSLKSYFEETKRALDICKGLLDTPCGDNSGVIYSLMLRLRGLFLARCILRGEKYSNKDLEAYAKGKGIDESTFEKLYAVYRASGDERPIPKKKIPVKHIRKLYEIDAKTLEDLKSDAEQKTKEKH